MEGLGTVGVENIDRVVLRLRPGITGPATLKYRLEDEMIFATVLGRKVRFGGKIVLYQPDESITMEVRLDASHDTVWLNRQQMAELFERDVKTIGKLINNALQEELAVDSVGVENATTQKRLKNNIIFDK